MTFLDGPMLPEKSWPLEADHPLVGNETTVCPGCHDQFDVGDIVMLITIGPGADPEERVKAREGRAYTAVAIPAHWSCVTGEEE